MPVFLFLTCIPIELAPLVNVVKKNKNAIRIPLNYLFFATLTRQMFLPFRLIKIEAPVITILINCLPDYHPTDSSKKQTLQSLPDFPSPSERHPDYSGLVPRNAINGDTRRDEEREGGQRKAHRPRGSQPEDQRRNGGVYNTGGGGGRLRRSPLEGL